MLRLLLVANDSALDPRVLATFERDGVRLTLPSRRDRLAESVAADPPDAAALDLGLPDGEGWRLLRSLRERLDSSALPIVGLTSQDTAEERLRAFSLGADDVIRNPFDAHELVLRTRGVVAAQRDRSAALRGSLEIYPLPGLLQSCERSSWTGLLKVSGGEGSARIYFHHGKVTGAESGELSGLPALWSALQSGYGDFVLTVDSAHDQAPPGPPVVASVRSLLIDVAWAADGSEDEPQIHFPDEIPEAAWEPVVPVLSIFYAPSAHAGLRAFLATLPSSDLLPLSLAGAAVERGERRVAWDDRTQELLVRYSPLDPATVAEMLRHAREAAGVVLWLGSDLSAGGVPMALPLLHTAARGAGRLILVADSRSAGETMISEVEEPSRWALAPDDPVALAALLWEGSIPLSHPTFAPRGGRP